MRVSDFDFELPDALIARHPAAQRDRSRLLVLRRDDRTIAHHHFEDLPSLLRPNDVVVANDTKVLRARLMATKKGTGGKVELLLVRPEGDERWRAMVNASKKVKAGQVLLVADQELLVEEILGEGFATVRLPGSAVHLTEAHGEMPLPPYLRRAPEPEDLQRYQTIFARDDAQRSVAAPTAGLHFTRQTLIDLAKRGIERAKITLDVGPGTFLPVRVEEIEAHRMHSERFEVDAVAATSIERARTLKGRVLAVGTTVTRVLETIGRPVRATAGETDIFIRPGHTFVGVDLLLTNFHLPKSTLLMLVSAFAGYDFTMRAYREAVLERYRFFSYGDAMLIL